MPAPEPNTPQQPSAKEAADASVDPQPSPEQPSLRSLLTALREELILALHDRVHLITLEIRQAGIRAAQMVLLATLAALFLCSTWAIVLIGVYMACTNQGMRWGEALLVIGVLNLIAAVMAWLCAQALSHAFTFSATKRLIKNLIPQRPTP